MQQDSDIKRPTLIFVYNADSGLFNTLSDIGHKIFSPSTYECHLCAITHSYFSERKEWTAFINQLEADCEFLHRDQWLHTGVNAAIPLPAIFLKDEAKHILLVDAEAIKHCKSITELQNLITERLQDPDNKTITT